MKKLLVLSLAVTIFIISCKKDNEVPANNSTVTPAMARDSLYDIMNEWYYWYDVMPQVNKEEYPDPYALMEAMRYSTLDRWSFVADYDEFMNEMQGNFVGHGFRIGVDDAGKARIAMIYKNSPLHTAGVERGWIVKSINGVDIAPILLSNNAQAYTNAIGPSKAGVKNTFVFTKPDSTDVTVESTKAEFAVNTVLLYDTLHLTSGVAGHLVFESFIEPSVDELKTAFDFFKANNVNDLILDLRYNGGGYLNIAQDLASYIAGNDLAGTIFAKLEYNNMHQEQNSEFDFNTTTHSISLKRLVVITTRNTASASEAVMNGLKPHITVVSVGETTNGKPAGMNGWEIGKKYFMWPVTFKLVNSNNEGEYFNGIQPDKPAPDDITHNFDDRNESSLKEAIYYLQNGAFSAKSFRVFENSPQLSERPDWMKNTFIIGK